MIRRTWSRLILVVGMSLAFPLSSPAQTQQPAQVGNPPAPTRPLVLRAAQVEGIGRAPMVSAVPQVAASPAVTVGQSGLSFRYVQTFGVTEQAYPADTDHLNYPAALFIDGSNNVFILEDHGSRLLKYDHSGNHLLSIGTAGLRYTGDYVFSFMQDVVTDGSGNIWLAEENRIVEYTAGGVLLRTLPAQNSYQSGNDNTHFNSARGLAFSPAGDLYVGDMYNHRVQVYNIVAGAPVYSATIGVNGVTGNDNAHFNQPDKLAFDNLGHLFVLDWANNRVQRCSFSGTWTCDTLDSGLNNAYGLSTDSSGNVYIADGGNNRVRVCRSGACNTLIQSIQGFAADIAVDSTGIIYVADSFAHITRRYDSSGNELSVFKGVLNMPYVADNTRLNSPRGLAVAADGSLYVGEDQGHRLVKLNPDGTQAWAAGHAGMWGSDSAYFGGWWGSIQGNPAIDNNGRILAPDSPNSRIQIYNPNGSLYSSFGDWNVDAYQVDCPVGIAVNRTNGDVVIADRCMQRVRVYTSNYIYKATLGVTYTRGTDNAHFNNPWSVAVDSSGNIYVADRDNYRVQKCTLSGSSGTCATFAGETGVQGSDFGHFQHPAAITVDNANRVYVADEWANRVQVYDSTGAYLTTIGGNWGPGTGDLRNPNGIAVDTAGNVYVADNTNHRVQKYAPGVPGWVQRNINGMGDVANPAVTTLEVFGNQLYAGTTNWQSGSQLWRSTDGSTWTPASTQGFGVGSANPVLLDTAVFKSQLYAATGNFSGNYVGRLWRSADGTTWNSVEPNGFGNPNNIGICNLAVYSDSLYAVTTNPTQGLDIWRSSSGNLGDWTRVVSNGFGSTAHAGFTTGLIPFNGYLYAGVEDSAQGGAVWRTSNGAQWEQVSTNGFGDAHNIEFGGKAVFNGFLYMGSKNFTTGAQLWRSGNGTDWLPVVGDGFGTNQNLKVESLVASSGMLYALIYNPYTGMQVRQSTDGVTWAPANTDGFGDSNNSTTHWTNASVVFNQNLYLGTWNYANGGELWRRTVSADFNGNRTTIKPRTVVSFTNTSAGDYVTSTWQFGDGGMLTGQLPQVVTHTYVSPGAYTVTLMLNDGVDTNTITRTNYIQVGYRAYMPVALGSSTAPSMTLYDDFSDATYNAVLNPLKWSIAYGSPNFSAKQVNGTLVLSNTANTPASTGVGLHLTQPPQRSLRDLRRFQARLKMVNDHHGGWDALNMRITADGISGHGWWTECQMGGLGPQIECDVTTYSGGNYPWEYTTGSQYLSYDTWYTVTIDIDPNTALISFYLNGSLIGSHTPADASALMTASNFVPLYQVWIGDANTYGTRYVDDVQIMPANQ